MALLENERERERVREKAEVEGKRTVRYGRYYIFMGFWYGHGSKFQANLALEITLEPLGRKAAPFS